MQRWRRRVLWTATTLVVLLCAMPFCYRLIVDHDGMPCCHKIVMFAFGRIMHPNGGDISRNKKPFPNENGSSEASLATIANGLGDIKLAKDYQYIPGLREDDPGDLILLYFNRPTGWHWHGAPVPTIYSKKAWLIVPVDFCMHERSIKEKGELSERLSPEEFRVRLKRTLDFLRVNERPNWEFVVAEHTKLLDALGNSNR